MITPKEMLKPFSITSVCREDILATKKYPKKFVEGLQDWEMEALASKMANVFLDGDYWEAIEVYCDNLMEDKNFKKDEK